VLLRSVYQGLDAHQVTFLGRPLIPMHFTNAAITNLELKLEEVWGDDGLYLVKSWSPQDHIVGRGYIDDQKVNLQVLGFKFVTKAHRKADHPHSIHFLSAEAQDRVHQGDDVMSGVCELLKTAPGYDVH